MTISKYKKFWNLYKREGIFKATLTLFNYLYELPSRRRIKKMSGKEKFSWIYKNNHWNDKESVSGSGSTLEYTENLRKHLPNLIKQFKINSILDAPCGDFNWMQNVIPSTNCTYIGGDIVEELIEDLKTKHQNHKVTFLNLDITEQNLPKADLMICRDCLFHLSYEDIHKFLANFIKSEIPYLLTTTHINNDDFENQDLGDGHFFRRIDLFSKPFSFPKETYYSIADWVHPHAKREMCLFSRDQIKKAHEESLLITTNVSQK